MWFFIFLYLPLGRLKNCVCLYGGICGGGQNDQLVEINEASQDITRSISMVSKPFVYEVFVVKSAQ